MSDNDYSSRKDLPMTTTTPGCISDYPVFDPYAYSPGNTQLNPRVPHPVRDGLVKASSANPLMPMYNVAEQDFIAKNFADECMVSTCAPGAQFHDVTFLRCNLSLSIFQEARFSNVRFWDCILDYAYFPDAILTDVCFQGSSFRGNELTGLELTRVCYGHTHAA
jgi:hypothetical protein